MKVKLLGFDDRGKVRLSMKQVDQTTGEDIGKKKTERRSAAGLIPFELMNKAAREACFAGGFVL